MTERWWFRFDLDLRSSLGRRTHPDALVVQDDRNLVMAPPGVLEPMSDDEVDAAYRAAAGFRPLPLGCHLLRRAATPGEPWTYQAVVHDLDQQPSSRPGDVRRSLCGVIRDAQQRRFGFLAAEALGRWQGRGLSLDEMIEAFHEAITEMTPQLEAPVRLALLLDELDEVEEVSHRLRSRLLRRASRSFRTVDGDAAVVEVRNGGTRYHYRFVPGTLSGYVVTRAGVAG